MHSWLIRRGSEVALLRPGKAGETTCLEGERPRPEKKDEERVIIVGTCRR